ncbi:hypothetical protein GCM10009851_10570 [Herbiconiux moechotypicola]|uniref:Uncharacterized protein n=1 Tax=Herbiconiux moechotypicola TaxID=637393 RepID=A0ABN3DDP1_9MICO
MLGADRGGELSLDLTVEESGAADPVWPVLAHAVSSAREPRGGWITGSVAGKKMQSRAHESVAKMKETRRNPTGIFHWTITTGAGRARFN